MLLFKRFCSLKIGAWFLDYSIALLLVVAALATTRLLDPLLQETPAPLFYVAIMLSSWAGGLKPGLFATVLSVLALSYFFLEPRLGFEIVSGKTVFQLGVFATAAILISYLNESRLSAKRRADANLKSWRESEAQFAQLAEANIIGIFGANLNGTMTEANDAFLNMVGYTREDLLSGKIRWQEMTSLKYQAASQRSPQELRTLGACTPVEEHFIRKDGSTVPVLLGSVRQGTQRIVGFVLDLTESKRNEAERQQAEAALRESEERYRYLAEAIPQQIWMAASDGNMLDVNQRWTDYTGLTLEQVRSQGWQAIVHPDDIPVLTQSWTAAVAAGAPYQAEGRQRRKDGTYRWHLHQAVPQKNAQGQIVKWYGTATDIHDRKQIEEALRQSEERYRYLVEATPQLIWTTDAQGRNTYVSQQMCHYIGLSSAQLMDLNWQTVIHPDDVDRVYRQWMESVQSGAPYEAEYRLKHSDGSYRWQLVRAMPFRDEQGQILQWFGVSTDIHDKQELEKQRSQLLQQTQTAREEAERANRIKDEFLAVLSHELRSPLNPILGWTKLLQTHPFTPEKMAQALATIERNAKLQAQLIEDLLDVSRILQGKMVLNPSAVNLVTTIEAAIETVRLAAEAKHIQIHTRFDAENVTVTGDASRLQQIVWNLLTNAVKFTSNGGQIEVRLDRAGGFAQIQVQDTGKGINPEFLPYVFDYFRQEDGATTRKFGGLGLGLALVRHLTEQHGGTVGVESAGEEQGATFTVRLPLQALPPEMPQAQSPTHQPTSLKNLKILIVDDEADMRDLMQTILEGHHAQVKLAASAQEALAILEQWQPDALISDIGMPEMDGYMLVRQVRSLPPEQGGKIPAIALTAYAGEVDQQLALQAGFQKHLAKPIEPDVLIRSMIEVLELQSF